MDVAKAHIQSHRATAVSSWQYVAGEKLWSILKSKRITPSKSNSEKSDRKLAKKKFKLFNPMTWFDLICLLNGISTFECYLMPKLSLLEKTVVMLFKP